MNKKTITIIGTIILVQVIIFAFFCINKSYSLDMTIIDFYEPKMSTYMQDYLKTNYNINTIKDQYRLTIPTSSLPSITSLDLSLQNYSNLMGIDKFTYLEELNLTSNNYEDISLLSSLTNLKVLDLTGNAIKDVSALSSLTALEYLDLSRNKLVDTSSIQTQKLSQLTNLKYLDLSRNSLTTTQGLNTLTKLEYLNLFDNNVLNMVGLGTQTNLTYLNLGENYCSSSDTFTNLNNINLLTNLKYFSFEYNEKGNITNYITNLVNLEELDLSYTGQSESSNIHYVGNNLSHLTHLKKLYIGNNGINDLYFLRNMTSLEELSISRAYMGDLRGIYDNDTLYLPNLKYIDLSDCIYVHEKYGSHETNDDRINRNELIINELKEKGIKVDIEYFIDTGSLPHYDGSKPYVTYEDFGAKANGIDDDFLAMYAAHKYANEHNCEVRATAGKKYHIFNLHRYMYITINTSVDWKNSTIIIHDEDIEDYKARYIQIFKVSNLKDKIEINNPSYTINKNTKSIPQIQNELNELSSLGYNSFLVKVTNDNKKVYIRYGMNQNSGSSQTDQFTVDKYGNIKEDVIWDYDSITKIVIYGIPSTTLTIKNGNLITKNINKRAETVYTRAINNKSIYYYRNMYFQEIGNLEVSNINWSTEREILSGSYAGYLFFDIGANIKFNNSSFTSRVYKGNGRSTYVFVLNDLVNTEIDNVKTTSILEKYRWGDTGNNHIKNIVFKNCSLNRIDAHEGLHNLNVTNTTLGYYSAGFVGSGEVIMDRCTFKSEQFFNLREDYGSTFDGTVTIKNSIYEYNTMYNREPNIIEGYKSFDTTHVEHNFGYPLKMPNIYLTNITLDYKNLNSTSRTLAVIHIRENIDTNDYIGYWPDNVYINGINFINDSNNNKGVRMSNRNDIPFHTNLFVSNIKLSSNNKDITEDFDKGTSKTYTSNVNLEISKVPNINTTLSIYKNDIVILANKTITDSYSFVFKDNGHYTLKAYSLDEKFNQTGSKEYSFTLNKPAPTVTSITIEKNPNKLTYSLGDKTLDKTGGVIKVNYSDGTNLLLSFLDSNINIIGFDTSSSGQKTLTVKYKTFTTTYKITVNDIPKPPIKNETNTTNSTNTTKPNTANITNTTNTTNTTNSLPTITVINNTNETTNNKKEEPIYNPVVPKKQILKVQIVELPTKLKYKQNKEDLDLTDGVLEITYRDGSTDRISMLDSGIIYSGFDNTIISSETIIIDYNGYKNSYTIEVVKSNNLLLYIIIGSAVILITVIGFIFKKINKEESI